MKQWLLTLSLGLVFISSASLADIPLLASSPNTDRAASVSVDGSDHAVREVARYRRRRKHRRNRNHRRRHRRHHRHHYRW